MLFKNGLLRCSFSDEWRAYWGLMNQDLTFNYRKIKHKDNFVDPEDPRIHTQNIENRWGQIKSLMKKRGKISRATFNVKIKEITWRILNKAFIQEKVLELLIKK